MSQTVSSDLQDFDARWKALQEQRNRECQENVNFPEEAEKTLQAALHLFEATEEGEVLTLDQLNICQEAITAAEKNLWKADASLGGRQFLHLDLSLKALRCRQFITAALFPARLPE